MNKVLPQLQNGKIILLQHNSKTPHAEFKGDSWHIHNPTDKEILEWKKNIGFVCGSDNIRVIDIEGKSKGNIFFDELVEVLDTLKTLKISTPSGGFHYFIRNKDEIGQAYTNIVIKGTNCGEYRAKDCYVATVGSIVSGKEYSVVEDKPIKEIVFKDVKKILQITTDKKIAPVAEKASDKTKSGREYAEVCRIQKRAVKITGSPLPFEEIDKEMQAFIKWTTGHQQYRERTYERATQKILDEKIEKKDNIVAGNNFELKNYKYFERLHKDRRFIVEDFIYPGTVNALWSPPAHFKSLVANYLGMQITSNKPFLGLKTKKYGVLIMDNENHEQILKTRLMALRKGQKIKKKDFPLQFLTNTGAVFDSVESFDKIKQIIKKHKIKLLVLDTLHRFSNYEENSADEINRIYRDIFKPITELDCAILYLHHTGKDGNYRGSIDLLGCVDTAYSVKRRANNEFDLICEKSRFGELSKICGQINFDETNIRFDRLNEEEIDRLDKTKFMDIVTTITNLFSIKEDAIKRCDIMSELQLHAEKTNEKFASRSVDRALSWLIRKDKLLRDNKGKYSRKWEGEFKL